MTDFRPVHLCQQLLAALEASEDRRKRRQRDTTPDSIGFSIKRELLEAAVREDPAPDAFEAWLLERCLSGGERVSVGAVRMMALEVLHEWRLAAESPAFRSWLERGAPSADREHRG